MGARQSAEVSYGVSLHKQGLSIAESARIAGVEWSSIKRALNREKKKPNKNKRR
jgi:lambda repressor-like predicted transcriptional regulator